MSASSRSLYEVMLTSWKAFDKSISLSEQALSANLFKKYSILSQLVHRNFFQFDKDYRSYKADTIEKSAVDVYNVVTTDEKTGESIPISQYNDSWSESQMFRYSDMMEQLDDGIIDYENEFGPIESKEQGNVDFLALVAKAEFSAIESAAQNYMMISKCWRTHLFR